MLPVLVASRISTPSIVLAEMTLRSAGAVPPTRLLAEPFCIITPIQLPSLELVPLGSVPMKLPAMTLFEEPFRKMPNPFQLSIASPRMVLPEAPALRDRPLIQDPPAGFPFSSICNTALSPVARVLADAPDCV